MTENRAEKRTFLPTGGTAVEQSGDAIRAVTRMSPDVVVGRFGLAAARDCPVEDCKLAAYCSTGIKNNKDRSGFRHGFNVIVVCDRGGEDCRKREDELLEEIKSMADTCLAAVGDAQEKIREIDIKADEEARRIRDAAISEGREAANEIYAQTAEEVLPEGFAL